MFIYYYNVNILHDLIHSSMPNPKISFCAM